MLAGKTTGGGDHVQRADPRAPRSDGVDKGRGEHAFRGRADLLLLFVLRLRALLLMFGRLTEELLDLRASVKGSHAAAFAMVQTCCSSCCCCLGQGSGD
jgi:hypothetical protein